MTTSTHIFNNYNFELHLEPTQINVNMRDQQTMYLEGVVKKEDISIKLIKNFYSMIIKSLNKEPNYIMNINYFEDIMILSILYHDDIIDMDIQEDIYMVEQIDPKIEQDRIKQEKIEQEIIKQERIKQERIEQEKIKQEKIEQEKIELDKIEQEKIDFEQYKIEQYKIELDWKQKKIELELFNLEVKHKDKLKSIIFEHGLEQSKLEQKLLNLQYVLYCHDKDILLFSFKGMSGKLATHNNENIKNSFMNNHHFNHNLPILNRFYEAFKKSPTKKISIVFHGTPEKNIDSILCNSLNTSYRARQAMGIGEYFGKNILTSLPYCQGGHKMVVFIILHDTNGITTENQNVIVINKPEYQLPIGYITV